MKRTLLYMLGCALAMPLFATPIRVNHLPECAIKQFPSKNQTISFLFQEKGERFYHSFEPFQKYNSSGKGNIFINSHKFLVIDSVSPGKNTRVDKTQISKEELLILNNGDNAFAKVSRNDFIEYLFVTGRYSPVPLLQYFINARPVIDDKNDREHTIYELKINTAIVKLYIQKSNDLVSKISLLEPHELRGDQLTIFHYDGYAPLQGFYFPSIITIEKNNGLLHDEVKISNAAIASTASMFFISPAKFMFQEEPIEEEKAELKRYNEHIYFIDLLNADAKVMVIAFDSSLFLINAPLNSHNGDLIIAEARKIDPPKPIRYFAFGHHHPWSIGGMRAMVNNDISVMSVPEDIEYLHYLVKASHTLNPDSLHLAPKPLKTVFLKDSTTITEGKFEMQIYRIGKKSDHTNDYLIFYFPAEKLLFEDDLIWIKKEGKLLKAGPRQAGLYNAVKDLHLNIETIVQSWPLAGYGLKSMITMDELKQSVEMK